jgi:hypothetical protein
MLAFEHDFSIKNSPLPGWTRCQPVDPGWLYMLQHGDLIKVGKTTDPKRRLREARTWLPDGEVVGIKPFWTIHEFERTLLCGIANYWHEGEWHRFPNDSTSDFLIQGFRIFDDHDRNKNTFEFNYWIGGSGMGEVVMEQNHRRVSLRRFQHEVCPRGAIARRNQALRLIGGGDRLDGFAGVAAVASPKVETSRTATSG